MLSDNAVVLADAIVQKVLAPLLTPVISVVLFFVAFALLRMLVSMLVTVLGLVNRLPVIGTVNRWLGWVTGCVASTMDIYGVGRHRHHRRQSDRPERYGHEQQPLL